MRVYHSVMDAINSFGIESFAALVRENLIVGLEGVHIEILDDANFYRAFTYAYIAGAMSGDPQKFIEALGVDNTEALDLNPEQPSPFSGFKIDSNAPLDQFILEVEKDDLIDFNINTWVLPFTYGSTEADSVEVVARWEELLKVELLAETGLVSVIRSMFPGRYIDYKGDDLFSMVVESDI